jgi:hypothetical protein
VGQFEHSMSQFERSMSRCERSAFGAGGVLLSSWRRGIRSRVQFECSSCIADASRRISPSAYGM